MKLFKVSFKRTYLTQIEIKITSEVKEYPQKEATLTLKIDINCLEQKRNLKTETYQKHQQQITLTLVWSINTAIR